VAKVEEARSAGVPGNERINAFSDGVFAIAITLLVLELKVPEIPPESAAGGLVRALLESWPKLLTHVLSFIVLGIYWVGHHNMFLHIKRHDRVLLWLNIMFLMFVAIMPFPTALLSRYSEQQAAVIVYCSVLILTGLSLDTIWWYASKDHRLIDRNVDPVLIAFVHRRVLMAPAAYAIAIALSFINSEISKIIIVIVGLAYIFPNPLDVHHHRHLNADE
jgi:uncharacterized membrane protein